jgi:hypothetical protein
MNVINRLIVMVELIVALLIVPAAIVVVLFFFPGIAGILNNLARSLTDSATVFLVQLICVLTLLTVFFIVILLLFLELSTPRAHLFQVQVTDGRVQVTEQAIVQRLEHSIAQIAEIALVKAHVVASKGNAIEAFIELETSPQVNVPQKTQEVIALAKQVLEQQIGLKVAQVRVRLNYSRVQAKSQNA